MNERTVWNDLKIKNEIFKAMNILMINRMPSKSELDSIKKSDLDNAISRSKGYRGWAEYLNLSTKKSETRLGQQYEFIAIDLLKEKGFSPKKMSTRFPYDLLINDKVKIDVKSAKQYKVGKSEYYTFGIRKEFQTCDIYILFLLNDAEEHLNTLIIPSHFVRVKTLTFPNGSTWFKFKEKWDYVNQYLNFFQSIG